MQTQAEDSAAEGATHGGAAPHVADTATTAKTVFEGAASWFSKVGTKVGTQAREAAAAVGQYVDTSSKQLNEAYEARLAKDTAHECERRDKHRLLQEAAVSPERQTLLLEQSHELMSQCLSLAGDVQQELQYASAEDPIGRESYGLLMLINVLVPVLEHGLRQDWKSVLPATSALSLSSRWIQNLTVEIRQSKPTVLHLLEATESGWNDSPPLSLGLKETPAAQTDQQRLQAWLRMSLNQGLLSQKLALLAKQRQVLLDWYFPWALMLQEGVLNEFLTELVKIDSQNNLYQLPADAAISPTAKAPGNPLSPSVAEQLRNTFTVAGTHLTRAGRAAVQRGNEVIDKGVTALNIGAAKDTATSSNSASQSALQQQEEGSRQDAGEPHGGPERSAGAQSASDTHVLDSRELSQSLHVSEATGQSGAPPASWQENSVELARGRGEADAETPDAPLSGAQGQGQGAAEAPGGPGGQIRTAAPVTRREDEGPASP